MKPIRREGELDSVLAELLSGLAKDERVEIHHETCEVDDLGGGCTCEALTIDGPLPQA